MFNLKSSVVGLMCCGEDDETSIVVFVVWNSDYTHLFSKVVLMAKLAEIDKIRVILVGDSGVGKSSLTHLIAHNEPLIRPSWTVGCSVEVKLHEYREGTPLQRTYFVELWDVGGSLSHKNARGVFYQPTHGIILVHDLTNRKSNENLRKWLIEILNKDGKDTMKSSIEIDFDPEQFIGSTQIPILAIGTKLDLLDDKRRQKHLHSVGGVAEKCGVEEICLNCHDVRSLAAGTTDAVKLARFFDKVVEKKYFSKESGMYATEKRKFISNYPTISVASNTNELHRASNT